MRKWILLAVLTLSSALAWGASDDSNTTKGKMLFESSKLGTNGKSCLTCHPGGRKLEWPATYPEEKLTEVINTCITKALKGKALGADSAEMKDLLRYIRTFAGP